MRLLSSLAVAATLAALALPAYAHDHDALKSVRRHIHSLNRQIRAHLAQS